MFEKHTLTQRNLQVQSNPLYVHVKIVCSVHSDMLEYHPIIVLSQMCVHLVQIGIKTNTLETILHLSILLFM